MSKKKEDLIKENEKLKKSFIELEEKFFDAQYKIGILEKELENLKKREEKRKECLKTYLTDIVVDIVRDNVDISYDDEGRLELNWD